MNIRDKAQKFRELHASSFVIANAWDGGSARILASLGFPALATSSGACAATLGRRDGFVTRDEALEHARIIVESTELPVSADLERCFADEPTPAAETIRLAADVGLVGGSIEDATRTQVYEFDDAVERVAAAARVARSLSFPFTLTARSENFLRGKADLEDTIRRLQAFEKAGADVLMAPGLPDLESVRKVCSALKKPFNFMGGIKGKSFSVAELQAAGVRRISLATSLYRMAVTGLIEAAREVKDKGTFGYLDRSLPSAEVTKFMRE